MCVLVFPDVLRERFGRPMRPCVVFHCMCGVAIVGLFLVGGFPNSVGGPVVEAAVSSVVFAHHLAGLLVGDARPMVIRAQR